MNLTSFAADLPVSVINLSTGQSLGCACLVDTGADVSIIDSRITQALQAVADGSDDITGVNSSPTDESVYQLDINLGSSGYVSGAQLTAVDDLLINNGYDLLIGVDILSTGTFDYDGPSGTFFLQIGIGTGQPVTTVPNLLLYGGIMVALVGIAGVIWVATSDVKLSEAAFMQGFETGRGSRF